MKVKFDGKDLEVKPFTLGDFAELEKQGVSLSEIVAKGKRGELPKVSEMLAVIGRAIRNADSSYKTDEEVGAKIQMNDEVMTYIIKAIVPGGKVEIPFTSK